MKKTIWKKVVSGVLSAGLLLSACGCAPIKPSSSPTKISVPAGQYENAAEAYRAVIQNKVARYGYLRSYENIDNYLNNNPATACGVIDVKEADFTSDGQNELVCSYFKNGAVHLEIYEFTNGRACRVWSGADTFDGLYLTSLQEADGKVVLEYRCENKVEVVGYVDGEFKTGSSFGAVTDEELASYQNGGIQTETDRRVATSKLYLTRFGISDNAEVNYIGDFCWDSRRFTSEMPEDFSAKWNVKIPAPRYTLNNAFQLVTYFGDKSACKMTKQMAKAYGEVIEKLQNETPGTMFVYTALADPNGDGMPVLITVSGAEEEVNVWTYNENGAQKYNFFADMKTDFIESIYIYPNSRDVHIAVTDGVSQSVGDCSGKVYYRIANGQLEKVGSYTAYTAFAMGDGTANGTQLPGVNAQKTDYGYTASVADLLAAGWCMDAPALYAVAENDKLRPMADVQAYHNYMKTANDKEKQWGTQKLIMQHTEGEGGNEIGDLCFSVTLESALERYAITAGKPYYSYPEVMVALTEKQLEQIGKQVQKDIRGTIEEIYRLSDDLYYAVAYENESFTGGAVLKNRENGTTWHIIATDTQPITEERLSGYVGSDNTIPNITIDFTKIDDGAKHLNKALSNIDGTVPNDAAKAQILQFVQEYITRAGGGTLKSRKNAISVTKEGIGKFYENAAAAKKEMFAVLNAYGVDLNKTVETNLQILAKRINTKRPLQIVFDGTCLDCMGDNDTIAVVFGSGKDHSVKVNKATLQDMVDVYGALTVTMQQQQENNYLIQYCDASGNVVAKTASAAMFTVPAAEELNTVHADYTGGSANWGGQFDAANKTLSFETPYSGTYAVTETATDITDIAQLSAEHQKAIRFMVSKGFFTVENNAFAPTQTLTRYNFANALVRMFFALDNEAVANFADVPADSVYYPYVASGNEKNIIKGYEDNTFRGENAVTRQEVIALCSRTLMDQKGYQYPENASDYLHFNDSADIPDWAKQEIALAVRETLVGYGGMLLPTQPISRADSALMLYRLFALLYETEPQPAANATVVVPIACGVVGVAMIAAAAVVIPLRIKRKKKNL